MSGDIGVGLTQIRYSLFNPSQTDWLDMVFVYNQI